MHIPTHITPDLLGVSAQTVRDWRADRRRPGATARILLDLHCRQRIMPEGHAWAGFGFHGGDLVADNGYRLTAAQCSQLPLLYNMLDNYGRDMRALKAELARLDAYISELEGKRAPANAARALG